MTENSEDTPLLGKVLTKPKSQTEYSRCAAFLIFLFPAFGGLLFGYDIGATSAVIAQITSSAYSGVIWYDVVADSSLLQGTITSIGMFGAMLGSLTCFAIADDIGRRRTLLIAACLFVVGASVEGYSVHASWGARAGVSVLLLGRVCYGYGCGFAMHGAPAYIGEMSPSAIRGLLVSLKEAFIVLGMVLGYSIGYSFSEIVGGWRYTFISALPVAVAMFAGMMYLPPSARWLALKGRLGEARKSLEFVTPHVSAEELDALKETAQKAQNAQSTSADQSTWGRFSSPSIFPALVAGVGLVFLQQVTGQPSVLYYADTIFVDVGLSTMASIGVSVFKLIATLFATVTVDNYGRKLLLYIGCSLMFVALLFLGTAFLFPYMGAADCQALTTSDECNVSCSWSSMCSGSTCSLSGYDDDSSCSCCETSRINSQKALILASLFLYIGGYQVGFGPISWLIISEIFPLEVRGKAVSIAVVTNFFWNTVMTFFFPVEMELIGTAATFYVYAIILGVGIYFVVYYVPETKGLSLEEIENYFVRSSRVAAHLEDKESIRLAPAI